MDGDIDTYNSSQPKQWHNLLNTLSHEFNAAYTDGTSKIFHRNPAWFLDGNPIVGYYVPKSGKCVRVMFWSGQSFGAPGLVPEGSFKAATRDYTSITDIDIPQLQAWLNEARTIQWDYKNIVKNRGVLHKIEG